MNQLTVGGKRMQAYHGLYVGEESDRSGRTFFEAFHRFVDRRRQTLLDVTMEATAAQWQVDSDFGDLDPRLQQAITETVPSLQENDWLFLDDETRLGAINAAKGKYFEYLVVDRLNAGEQVGDVALATGQTAMVAESMNQPGWDVRILQPDGSVDQYLQLKATESAGYIQETLQRYPDIQVLANEEVAGAYGEHVVLNSAMSEEDLRAEVAGAIETADHSVVSQFLDYFSPLMPLMAMVSIEGYRLGIGEASLAEFNASLDLRIRRLVAIKVAGATVYALGGGWLAIPAAFAGGIWYDRAQSLRGIHGSYGQRHDRLRALLRHQGEREQRRIHGPV